MQQQTKNPYYATIHNEYAEENPKTNLQYRQKITFPGSAYPKEISQQCAPATHTQKQCTARGSSWGLPSLSLTTEGSWRLDPPWGMRGTGGSGHSAMPNLSSAH